jgi:hypothetical protein
VKEFDKVIFSPQTNLGEVVGPVQTQVRFIIKCDFVQRVRRLSEGAIACYLLLCCLSLDIT